MPCTGYLDQGIEPNKSQLDIEFGSQWLKRLVAYCRLSEGDSRQSTLLPLDQTSRDRAVLKSEEIQRPDLEILPAAQIA